MAEKLPMNGPYAEVRWSGSRAPSTMPDVDRTLEARRAYKDRLGLALRKARDASGYTQEDAAHELGIDNDTLSRWENSERGISAFDLARVVELYGAEPAVLLLPPDRLSELDARLASVRQAAVAAGRVDAAGVRLRLIGGGPSPRRGRPPGRRPPQSKR